MGGGGPGQRLARLAVLAGELGQALARVVGDEVSAPTPVHAGRAGALQDFDVAQRPREPGRAAARAVHALPSVAALAVRALHLVPSSGVTLVAQRAQPTEAAHPLPSRRVARILTFLAAVSGLAVHGAQRPVEIFRADRRYEVRLAPFSREPIQARASKSRSVLVTGSLVQAGVFSAERHR